MEKEWTPVLPNGFSAETESNRTSPEFELGSSLSLSSSINVSLKEYLKDN